MPYQDIKLRRKLSQAQTELAEKMLREVSDKKYRAVSFKFSGALVTLPFAKRSDMFAFMEDDFAAVSHKPGETFSDLRTRAEDSALKKNEIYVRVSLKKIYDIFEKLSGVSHADAEKLMQRECELAEQFAVPRECAKQLFREAKNCKKRVIVAAETIYPAETVKNILEKCGYGSYDGLVYVGDIKDCTGESYYEAVLKKAGVSADKLLHIGGDVAFDIELPIVKGSKALLMSDPQSLMARSGRIRGACEEKDVLRFDSLECVTIRLAFGLYALYGFDTPQNKTALSDVCSDAYLMGFIILGPLSLAKDFTFASQLQAEIAGAMEKVPEMTEGRDDFLDMFRSFFGDTDEKYGTEGCELPLQFAEKSLASADRKLLTGKIAADTMKKWNRSVKDPDIVPFSAPKRRQNKLSKLADKMFPPGTKVRTITDNILTKMHIHQP